MKSLSVLVLLLIATQSFSQDASYEHWCGTAHKHNSSLENPAILESINNDALIRLQEQNSTQNIPKGTIFKIPVVFHVLHNGGEENTSEEQILNALEVINRDFRLQNPDTSDINVLFKPIMGDVEIEFVMARKAPDGSCFRGYTRTFSPLTFEGDNGQAQVQAIQNGNDVFQGNWSSYSYLNVFIVADAGGAGGYTNYPSNWSGNAMSNGIWILHQQFGEIGTSSFSAGRSLTHEIGHWLNLPHTWGSSNTPGEAGNCSLDDGITDTPQTLGVTGGCPQTQNDCGPIANVQNYMDYALSCQSMFTIGQVAEMRTAIQSSVGGRNNLWTAQNLADTGSDIIPILCKAEFKSDRVTVCAGTDITFTDESYNNANGWTWSFDGGTPPNSTDQNPVITYNTPGLYAVTLNSTDGSASDTEIKTSYIRVLPTSSTMPFVEGFESFSTLTDVEEWSIINNGGNGFELASTTGDASSKSARLMNFAEIEGTKDELISSPVDLSSVTGQMTLTYRYAHKRRTSTDDDWLKVYVTTDCGLSWGLRKSSHGAFLSTEISNTSFTPSSADDWQTVHITNITSALWVDNFRYKFEFEAGGGNNMYIDNINLYQGTPSSAGLSESSEMVTDLVLYPNPANNELNVSFSVNSVENAIVEIQELTGKIAQSHLINANEGSNLVMVDTSKLASGIYFMKLNVGGRTVSKRFVKQ